MTGENIIVQVVTLRLTQFGADEEPARTMLRSFKVRPSRRSAPPDDEQAALPPLNACGFPCGRAAQNFRSADNCVTPQAVGQQTSSGNRFK